MGISRGTFSSLKINKRKRLGCMLDMRKVCSDSEFIVRKELTGFLCKNFNMSPGETFMWVSARVIPIGEGFTTGEPYKKYAIGYLLREVAGGKHYLNDIEMAILADWKSILSRVTSRIGGEDMSLVKKYYLDRVGISKIVEESGKSYGVIKKIFASFQSAFSEVVGSLEREYSLVKGTSILSLRIGWKPKSLLWNAGIHSVEDLYTCFYTGSTDVGKILNERQMYILNDALKNLETV